MTTSIDYFDVEAMLKSYYEKEYEGCAVDFKIETHKTTKWSSGWDDYSYEVSEKRGKLTVYKVIEGFNKGRPLSFEKYCSESEMQTILKKLLSERFATESFKVMAVYFRTNKVELSLEKINEKRLVKV